MRREEEEEGEELAGGKRNDQPVVDAEDDVQAAERHVGDTPGTRSPSPSAGLNFTRASGRTASASARIGGGAWEGVRPAGTRTAVAPRARLRRPRAATGTARARQQSPTCRRAHPRHGAGRPVLDGQHADRGQPRSPRARWAQTRRRMHRRGQHVQQHREVREAVERHHQSDSASLRRSILPFAVIGKRSTNLTTPRQHVRRHSVAQPRAQPIERRVSGPAPSAR